MESDEQLATNMSNNEFAQWVQKSKNALLSEIVYRTAFQLTEILFKGTWVV